MSVRRWAPRLGEHNEEIIGSNGRARRRSLQCEADKRRPREAAAVRGLKVADSRGIAGPQATKYLADHGATVVRVETENPPCRLRTMGPYKDTVPGTNRSHAFGEFNTSKLGITLDLKNPSGIDVAKRLIEWCDVYVENFTPGTVDGLGIGYEVARQLNPSVIMASSCLMGQTGPAPALRASATTLRRSQASSRLRAGRTSLPRGPGPPIPTSWRRVSSWPPSWAPWSTGVAQGRASISISARWSRR